MEALGGMKRSTRSARAAVFPGVFVFSVSFVFLYVFFTITAESQESKANC